MNYVRANKSELKFIKKEIEDILFSSIDLIPQECTFVSSTDESETFQPL